MLDQILDHPQKRAPLPVGTHQVELQTDINGLLLDVLGLHAIAGVHDRSARRGSPAGTSLGYRLRPVMAIIQTKAHAM